MNAGSVEACETRRESVGRLRPECATPSPPRLSWPQAVTATWPSGPLFSHWPPVAAGCFESLRAHLLGVCRLRRLFFFALPLQRLLPTAVVVVLSKIAPALEVGVGVALRSSAVLFCVVAASFSAALLALSCFVALIHF